MRKIILLFNFSLILAVGNSFSQTDILKDSRDGKEYKIVQIGSQTWMAENLAYGTPIPSWPWVRRQDKIFCYKDDSINCVKYGMLYTWEAALKACPIGWHLPSEGEFTTLFNYAGTGDKVKAYNFLNDSTKFNASLGGWLHHGNSYHYIKKVAKLWSISGNGNDAKDLVINKVRKEAYISSGFKSSAVSVRCIKD